MATQQLLAQREVACLAASILPNDDNSVAEK
jgi:hypothetical protein